MPWTDSEVVEADLPLLGVWIHDPGAGGQDTSRHYLYGSAQRDDALDVMGEARYFAGRSDPVVDYGEHQALTVGVTLDIPHGPTWRADLDSLQAFAAGRTTVHFRDNRGRSLYGQLSDFKRKDAEWGTQVSFTVTQSAWDLETVA